MKQLSDLSLKLWLMVAFVTQIICQVQGGIITNQQSLALPDSLALATVSNGTSENSNKNATRSGRVVYTASYSNVRISSKEPKSMDKYFPLPAVVYKKTVMPAANIVPVGTTTTTTTTEPSTITSSSPSPSTTETFNYPEAIEAKIPDVLEFIEESEPMNEENDTDVDDELVTEAVKEESTGSSGNNADGDDEGVVAVTEPNIDYKLLEVAAV